MSKRLLHPDSFVGERHNLAQSRKGWEKINAQTRHRSRCLSRDPRQNALSPFRSNVAQVFRPEAFARALLPLPRAVAIGTAGLRRAVCVPVVFAGPVPLTSTPSNTRSPPQPLHTQSPTPASTPTPSPEQD